MDRELRENCPCSESSKLGKMQESIGKIEVSIVKIDTNLEWITKQMSELCEKTADNEKEGRNRERRLSVLEDADLGKRLTLQEKWQSRVLGALGILSIVFSVGMAIALKIIN